MALTTFVYIGDVDNLSDARFAAGIGVELVGFRLDPKEKKFLNPDHFREITEWITGVKIVGEFGDSKPAQVEQLLIEYKIDYIQISDATYLYEFTELGKPLILKCSVNEETIHDLPATLSHCSGSIDYFLLESEISELSKSYSALIKSLSTQYPLILGFGINVGNASTIAEELNLKGISLKGSPELRPGYKDFNELADILETLEAN